MHFQEKRLYGFNAVTMATSPIFFHNHPFPSPDISSKQKNMVVLCSTVGGGGVTPISRPLLENDRSTIKGYSIRAQWRTIITLTRH